MNILIFDAPQTLSTLLRSTLSAAGYPLSLSADAGDAILKLETALFDTVIIGPEGVPPEVADYLQEERPDLPLILVGRESPVPTDRPALLLPHPVDLGTLLSTLRRWENERRETPWNLPATCSFGDGAIACRASRVSRTGMVAMPEGSMEQFTRFFRASGGRNLQVLFENDVRVTVQGQVRYVEPTSGDQVRLAGIVFSDVPAEPWERFCRTLVLKRSHTL